MTEITYEYEMNAYYGIHYDIELSDIVYKIAKNDKRFAKLTNSKRRVIIDGKKIYVGTNSDIEGSATRCMIFVDKMTFASSAFDNPVDNFLHIEPAEMSKREKNNPVIVNAMLDLYDSIIAYMKKENMELDGINHGWQITTCTWQCDD